jgi:hypothetical protein
MNGDSAAMFDKLSSPIVRWSVGVIGCVVIGWLVVVTFSPALRDEVPTWLAWYGTPGSVPTIVLVFVVTAAVCTTAARSGGRRRLVGAPVTVIAVLIGIGTVLGLSAYWTCHDVSHPAFFTPLLATAQLLKGDMSEFTINGNACPIPSPAALEVARLAAIAALLTGLISVVAGVFRNQVDKLRASVADSVTVIVGVDDETQPMISRAAQTLDRRSTLVVLTNTDDNGVQQARRRGARVVVTDITTPSVLVSLRLWRNLERLYLMASDPAMNMLWLDLIGDRLAEVGHRDRVPLVVRIDDPWMAEAWRAQQFGGSDTRWAADVVGKYRATAQRLLERILAGGSVERIFLCGTTQLTLALCADLTRRAVERDFYTPPGTPPLPAFTLVGTGAAEYLRDHEFHRTQSALGTGGPQVDAVTEAATVPTMLRLLDGADPVTTAVILVDTDAAAGTRLAARFPQLPIYAPDLNTGTAEDEIRILGSLQSYSLVLGVDGGADRVQDAWERAATLIHERYVSTVDPEAPRSAAAVPWAQLNEFYQGSNRRTVRNMLWMVEQIAGHTWNTWGSGGSHRLTGHDVTGLAPSDQLAAMGFDHDVSLDMAKAEHEDWCSYYQRNGWKYGPTRDDTHRIHDKLVAWSEVESRPELLESSVRSLAATLWSLRQLGYRSRPLWRRFKRVGTVAADQRSDPFTWTSDTGHTMQADAGDWAVREGDKVWSVRDNIFRSSYEDAGDGRWRRRGYVQARPARAGEVVDTLEGPTTAAEGDWIVKGADGEVWPINRAEFARRYAEVDHAEKRG